MSASLPARWIEALTSTDAADRPAAEDAVRRLYAAASLTEPRHFVWFESPAAAVWALACLHARTEALWRMMVEAIEKTPDGRRSVDAARKALEAAPAMGDSMGMTTARRAVPDAGGSLPMRVTLARLKLPGCTAATTPAPVEEVRLVQALIQTVARQVCGTPGTLIADSPLASYTAGQMAADEAHLESQSSAPPEILAAAWAVARSVHLWWAFTGGVVLVDRPRTLALDAKRRPHCGDGPAVVYRDGTRVFAWEGQPLPERYILAPATLKRGEIKECGPSLRAHIQAQLGDAPAPAKKKPSGIFKLELPADVPGRLAALREAAGGTLPLLDRYQAGEREKVWQELAALGPAVRQDPHAADALAVAYETMRRVGENVGRITARLQTLGYRFHTEASAAASWIESAERATSMPIPPTSSASPHIGKLLGMISEIKGTLGTLLANAKAAPHSDVAAPHTPPPANVRKLIAKLEKKVGSVPLSLRAFYEVVGAVNWIGSHPTLAPAHGSTSPDPLVVYGAEEALEAIDALECEAFPVSPDDLHKANTSGGSEYEIDPAESADGVLVNERHALPFVDYLRLVFRSGGFPGYEGLDRGVPPELEGLRADLLEF